MDGDKLGGQLCEEETARADQLRVGVSVGIAELTQDVADAMGKLCYRLVRPLGGGQEG